MLKFLDDRTHEKPRKSPIKYKPDMIYGISVESPSTFQTPYTIINSQTYVNPYLEIQHNRLTKLPVSKSLQIKPEWTKKTNLQMVQEQKILTSQAENPGNSPLSRYRKAYYEELDKNEGRFKIVRGEFTDFIEKNNRYKSVAPLHGMERTSQRIQNTKRTVWEKRVRASHDGSSKMLYSSYYDLMRKSSMNSDSLNRNQSNMSNNSKLLSQKTRIRDSRQKMNASFHKNLQLRKHSLHYKVQLPKVQSQFITAYRPAKIKCSYPSPKQENSLDILDEFQQRLAKKIK